ncbi:INSERTASE putative (DUF1685)-RELATED [Salix viminalis]|uniref:INSERTASE putative (DUF1685)-RELATED n=1 Tax=Salix viminalis TaxID=40686 RepID=A0A9Q0SI89_SALVM|nr:INSERTASE putative (DUF1685)-RELATED [Salix viminalis]
MSLQNPHPPRPPPPSPPEEQVEYLPPIRKQQHQQHHRLLGASPLYKQHSWSPDIYRDEAWLKRKEVDPRSPHTIFGPGENPQTVKTRLRQWAQVVACSVRQSPSSS